jgi:hypothetical protein
MGSAARETPSLLYIREILLEMILSTVDVGISQDTNAVSAEQVDRLDC